MNPGKRPQVPGAPEEWVQFAESDVRLARPAAGDPAIRREQACFRAWPAAEKAFHAALPARRNGFLLPQGAEQSGLPLPELARKAGFPGLCAIPIRYPGFSTGTTNAGATEALETTEAAAARVKGVIEIEPRR